jgi:hypothetical protein
MTILSLQVMVQIQEINKTVIDSKLTELSKNVHHHIDYQRMLKPNPPGQS